MRSFALLLCALASVDARAPPLALSGGASTALGLRGGASSAPTLVRRAAAPSTTSMLEPKLQQTDAERIHLKQQFARPEVRTAFLSKVFGVVTAQVLFTVAIIFALRLAPHIGLQLMPASPGLFMLAMAPALALSLSPALAEATLWGPLLLALFTLLTGLGLGASTLRLPAGILIRAGAATLAAAGGLATYATTTRRDFTAKRGMLASGLLALLVMGLLQLVLGGPWIASARAYVGALVFSAYLVHDAQLIAGGGKTYQLRPTQHILGAMMIYQDLLNLFLTVLQAMARNREN